MSNKPRRQFTPEQKAEAVQIVRQSGKPISQIAKELGLTESALRNWVKQAQTDEIAAQERFSDHPGASGASQVAPRGQTLADGARFSKKDRSLFCCRDLKSYELIEAEKANFPVALMCEVLEVSRSGYYAWSRRPPATRTQENQQLKEQIKQIHQKSRNSYGAPRIHAALKQEGFEVGRHRVARLMAQVGICVRPKRKFKSTTDSNHSFAIADNVLNRNFTTQQPDQAWVADITYILTAQGWLYLAVIIDLFSRRVVGWSMSEHMRVELVLNALKAVLGIVFPRHLGYCSTQIEEASMPVAIIVQHCNQQGLVVV